ncbi:LPS-assembly protein LptD [Kaistia dalseonensis]|uniref:LPS-assembly protein LptD n=1 Tax=Kaistia dalseonensis TaxID=410840 RepID=A0ABU0H0D3_9HYPH|nr:LPS-assembly protein LptD [Kaistia dalseonensis]MCX5493210.1 LPS-assembly protein LptD [Kaistia dalseonensis]MDQ0435765.1 LPS-assembly protein [Kaistia dalseonensis]
MSRISAPLGPVMRTFSRLRNKSFALVALAALAVLGPLSGEALAQANPGTLGFAVDSMPTPTKGAQMLLESDQLVYDYDKSTVAAVGGVKMYYDGYTLEADRVTYDQKNRKMTADGRVKIVDRTGAIVTADTIDITEDFATGFVTALRLDTPTQTHFAAEKAYRDQGKTTTFYRGVYTACEPCRENPKKAPIWQVKAARIIADHNEHMIYFKSARLEFFGLPVAYFPAFSAPDPTVKRKSGFLFPSAGYTSALGAFAKTPYFWALAPNYDITFSPAYYTNQGFLLDAEWRHRLDYGQYTLEMAGIHQRNPEAFIASGTRNSGDVEWRGGARTTGEFYLNRQWAFGWDATLLSDRTFSRDYKVLNSASDVAISTVHLTGMSERNYLDLRGYYFEVLTNSTDPSYDQGRQAIVRPVMDQNYIFDKTILGGQLTMTNNVTSLQRSELDYIDQANTGVYQYGDPVLGLSGNFNRASTNWTWQSTVMGPVGMVLKPFAYLQADAFYLDEDQIIPGISDQGSYSRAMPAVGMEWRWPIMASAMSSSFVFEPIAQMIVRPNEGMAGQLPNEDAQSLVFDDSTLFAWDKFSGYDRVEGGTRINAGFRYLANIGSVATVQGVVGQSYQVAGLNSFAVEDLTQTGTVSGLQDNVSDYVGSMTFDGGMGYFLTARGRVDAETFDVNQAQLVATGKLGDVTASASYLYMRDVPAIGSSDQTETTNTVSGRASWQFTESWRVFGSIAWDIEQDQMAGNGVGIAYDDECTTFSIAYTEIREAYTDLNTSKTLLVSLQLRTLGGTSLSSNIGNLN